MRSRGGVKAVVRAIKLLETGGVVLFYPVLAGQFKDIVFSGGRCMRKCVKELGDLSEIADPKNIEKLINNLDNLCEKYQGTETCAAACPDEEKKQFETATTLLRFICVDKKSILSEVLPCITQNRGESILACDEQCGSLTGLVSSIPTDVDFMTQIGSMGPVCNALKCTVRCLKQDMNTRCPTAGDLIKEIATKQVEVEENQLNSEFNNRNNTHTEHLIKLLRHLPSDCAFVMETDHFQETIDAANEVEQSTQAPEVHPEESQPQGNETVPETNEIQPGQALTKSTTHAIVSGLALFFAAFIALI
uniref:Chondroitin proteoglycan 4 domain-containing protein n=1 Tax=Plectus sambesii TaxID=2011161 RepID=A0A914X4Z7_9BILA